MPTGTSTAQNLIEAAYLRSTANAPGKLAIDQELINHLDRTHQGYCALLAAAAPERWLNTVLVTWSGSPPALTGFGTDFIDIHRVENTATGKEVTIGPASEKGRAWFAGVPFCWRQGIQLISRGATGDPAANDQATVYLLQNPTILTALTSTIDTRYPQRFEMLLILDLAIYLSLKDATSGGRKDELDALKAEREMHFKAFSTLTGIVQTATQTVWPGRATRVQEPDE